MSNINFGHTQRKKTRSLAVYKFYIFRNNKKAFIATDIGQLIIHDIENNIIEYSQNLKDKPVEFLLVSSSGQLVVMATLKGNITVLSADDSKHYFSLQPRKLIWWYCYYLQVYLVLLCIIDEVKHRFKHSQEIVNCMAEKNNILVVGTSGMAAKGSVWDITSGISCPFSCRRHFENRLIYPKCL